jgi:hypothetical protein
MALAVRNLRLLARTFGVAEVRRKLLTVHVTDWPTYQSTTAALNCRQLSLSSGKYCCNIGEGVGNQGRKESTGNKNEEVGSQEVGSQEVGSQEVGSQEVGSQEVGRLSQVVTSMQLTYTCRVCSTRHTVETAV